MFPLYDTFDKDNEVFVMTLVLYDMTEKSDATGSD